MQNAYCSYFVDSIELSTKFLIELDNQPIHVSGTSSFGIKRLHLKSKIAKHYGRQEECRLLANKALDIQVLRNKMTHPETSTLLRTLSYSYLEEGQFEKARVIAFMIL